MYSGLGPAQPSFLQQQQRAFMNPGFYGMDAAQPQPQAPPPPPQQQQQQQQQHSIDSTHMIHRIHQLEMRVGMLEQMGTIQHQANEALLRLNAMQQAQQQAQSQVQAQAQQAQQHVQAQVHQESAVSAPRPKGAKGGSGEDAYGGEGGGDMPAEAEGDAHSALSRQRRAVV